jgi:hypothetical protein
MTKHDQDLIAEAYNKVNEGFFDRIKARASQTGGAVKGLGQKVKGAAKDVAGKALAGAADVGGKALGVDASEGGLAQKGAALQKDATRDKARGARAGQEAKFKSYIANSAKTIANDLAKLGMEVDDDAGLIEDIQNVISSRLKQVTKSGQFRDAAGKMGGKVA